MTLLDFTCAAAIAIYAMFGGAFINAAITAPQNCRKLIERNWDDLIAMFAVGVLLLPVLAATAAMIPGGVGISGNPITYVAISHVSVFAVIYLCKRITDDILDPGPSAPPAPQETDNTR